MATLPWFAVHLALLVFPGRTTRTTQGVPTTPPPSTPAPSTSASPTVEPTSSAPTTPAPSVCFIGDAQADYDSSRDPRTLMGTYNEIDTSFFDGELDEEIVVLNASIYEHTNFGTNFTTYLFQHPDMRDGSEGWVLAETLPLLNESAPIFLTCFEESLFDCGRNRWFWGFNKTEHKITSVNVADGECSPTLCLSDLTLQLDAYGDNNVMLDGEYNRTWDADTGRYSWVNQRDPDLKWFYRESTYDGPLVRNWVLRENGADRVACAPGTTEMPLFCTTFVYAEGDLNADLSDRVLGVADETRWLLGSCDQTSAPTWEPSVEPTAMPTTAEPTVPTIAPSDAPTTEPTAPTSAPTTEPTTPLSPTADPTGLDEGNSAQGIGGRSFTNFAIAFLMVMYMFDV